MGKSSIYEWGNLQLPRSITGGTMIADNYIPLYILVPRQLLQRSSHLSEIQYPSNTVIFSMDYH